MDLTPEFLRTKYEDVELIGEGAHGKVYKCVHAGKTTAVKVLVALDPVLRARFQCEVNILRRIDHENIVKLFDAGETDGCYWYESEYANESHFGIMYGYIFYSNLDRVKYFRQICLGVQALHNLDPPIIHRDLKPSNILVFEYLEPDRHTVLKIADFGIAAIVGDASGLTTTGAALGTVPYMAPERRKNSRIKTPQSDIYSLGITFLEACTGQTIPSQENINLVPDLLKPIIEKMVRQYPGDRYREISEILESLNSFSYSRLMIGRELEEGGEFTVWHVNIGRELENALNALFVCNSDNVIDRVADLERKLDRLGDAHDHEADTIKNIPGSALALIEEANSDVLLRLVQRFDNAARLTNERDFFSPEPDLWSKFLADVFHISSHSPTK